MEAITQITTQEVLDHHIAAFKDADVRELLKDYTEESELLTHDGAIKGLTAIQSFFEEVFKIIPKGANFQLKQMINRDDVIYIAWNCDSPFVNIPMGTDTFLIENEKIKYQTLAAHIVPKQE
jgi:ketosteroid isomerase-like protein